MVKFIYYTGEYPTLCMGQLCLEIEGKKATFGSGGEYEAFWFSGGDCYLGKGFMEYVRKGKWTVKEECLPKKYRKYASEIESVINENIQYGCCGGCL